MNELNGTASTTTQQGGGPDSSSRPAELSNDVVRRIALPLHVQELERHLDLNRFVDQLDEMFSENLSVPSTSSANAMGAEVRTDNLWSDEAVRKKDLSALYNFGSVGKRKWIKSILLEESDPDSECEEQITDADIHVLLKIHKYRRKYQKRYHTDIMNSQYTYYSAGLLSELDRHPDHQHFIAEQYGFTMSESNVSAYHPPVELKKLHNVKRRKSSLGITSSMSAPICTNDCPEPPLKKAKIVKSPSFQITQTTNTHTMFETPNMIYHQTTNHVTADDKPSGFDPALKSLWKTIVNEDIPKAHTEKYIAKTYRSIVLKNIAMSCASFLQQSKTGCSPGKSKSRQKRQQKNEPIGLRPVVLMKSGSFTASGSSTT